ncbi:MULTISPECIES: RtcB family protein [unclassified Sphingobium]|uniref:RtcB family protein n=1 Tax=unclassified Sphingobium TaxID=2611147 RepID=UPI000D157DF1|nr:MULTISPECIES: RtcB family protein [unclassified Sphingobium]MBG6118201.1 tRNA-splicing ligase RtcB [Sphingobium sp. JAI105]PSO10010.1 RNA-splicing ligase RtcB [Sphingobium sp. AEW4]TWC98298.1 tRNA-splicing ligase RtcB [Sphingobium sp. AEW010]TWD18290.1 tRNA-splicing ligase RtcB [Sphingobium sp. AEW013]TWD20795.1 tRNA-splicing ligase RtcB [Sphingobium sp. AEW001]
MTNTTFEFQAVEGGVPIKMWTRGVPVDDKARDQLSRAAKMPFIFKHVAAMPDVHVGIGATVGSVIPTKGAVIPAAVGVDIGCGMMAARTSLMAHDLPDSLESIRSAIEQAVPHGRDVGRGKRDKGSWGSPPPAIVDAWAVLVQRFDRICEKFPRLKNTNNLVHLGTLGTGNHFIELCLDQEARVWVMLHSGSRGVGNAIGSFFIELAKQDLRKWHINLPDENLAYFPEGTDHFDDYVEAVGWAQDFAALNRRMMMTNVVAALRGQIAKPFEAELEAVNCHHNYVTRENHFGENVLVTRKGAVRAAQGVLGIIPGSMGAKSFIVRGLGNPESFDSCSHGAGRIMSRTEAKKLVTLDEHIRDTEGVECRKDVGVIDETPKAYKPIEAVMAAQVDLVEIVHTLKQVVCVKG